MEAGGWVGRGEWKGAGRGRAGGAVRGRDGGETARSGAGGSGTAEVRAGGSFPAPPHLPSPDRAAGEGWRMGLSTYLFHLPFPPLFSPSGMVAGLFGRVDSQGGPGFFHRFLPPLRGGKTVENGGKAGRKKV